MPTLVIGCGANSHNHGLLHHVTIDIVPGLNPTIVGSITDRTSGLYTNVAYRRHFDNVLFENIPAQVIASDADCSAIAGHLTLVMTANGRVRFRSGSVGRVRLPRLIKIFNLYNFVVAREFLDGVDVKRLDQLGVDRIPSDMTRDLDLFVDDEPIDVEFRRGGGVIRSVESPI